MSQNKMICPKCKSENVEGVPEDCDTGFCATGGGIAFKCLDCGNWWSG